MVNFIIIIYLFFFLVSAVNCWNLTVEFECANEIHINL